MSSLKIQFITEGDCTFALSQNVMYKGKMYDELMWAEISKPPHSMLASFVVRWEDDWANPVYKINEEGAKQYILSELLNHKPYVNGKEYEMEE